MPKKFLLLPHGFQRGGRRADADAQGASGGSWRSGTGRRSRRSTREPHRRQLIARATGLTSTVRRPHPDPSGARHQLDESRPDRDPGPRPPPAAPAAPPAPPPDPRRIAAERRAPAPPRASSCALSGRRPPRSTLIPGSSATSAGGLTATRATPGISAATLAPQRRRRGPPAPGSRPARRGPPAARTASARQRRRRRHSAGDGASPVSSTPSFTREAAVADRTAQGARSAPSAPRPGRAGARETLSSWSAGQRRWSVSSMNIRA